MEELPTVPPSLRRATRAFDELTGCCDRGTTLDGLGRLLGPADTGAGVIVVALADVDRINDRHGVAVADQVLVGVADRLRSCTRRGDRVGRVGPSEFAVVYPDVADEEMLRAIAIRMHATLQFDVSIPASVLPVRASVGAALGVPGDEPSHVVDLAVAAMHAARGLRLGQVVLAGDDVSAAAAR